LHYSASIFVSVFGAVALLSLPALQSENLKKKAQCLPTVLMFGHTVNCRRADADASSETVKRSRSTGGGGCGQYYFTVGVSDDENFDLCIGLLQCQIVLSTVTHRVTDLAVLLDRQETPQRFSGQYMHAQSHKPKPTPTP
jgi:hypothetical protein